jgi:hypothetical protein
MALNQPVVTLEGFNATQPAGPITLDNVMIENFSQQAVTSEFSNIVVGPGDVNFMPYGTGVNVTDMRPTMQNGSSTPRECVFPKLPAPVPPAGWKY